MQKYQVVQDFEDFIVGAIHEFEPAAEKTLSWLEQGFIKLFETPSADAQATDTTASTDAKPDGENTAADTQVDQAEGQAPVAPAPVTPTQPKVEPTASDKIIAETVSKFPTPPAPFEAMNPMLYAFCKGIEHHEVCVAPGEDPKYPQGTRAYFDKNPGNLKFRNQTNTVAEDKDGFAVFDTIEHGFEALAHQVLLAASGRSTAYKNPVWDLVLKAWRQINFYDFFKIYDSSYGDNPKAYAEDVAAEMGVSPETTLNHFL